MPPISKYKTLWSHFKRSANGTSAMCVHCKKTIQRSHNSTGNLIRHIRAKHPKQYAILLNDSHIDTSTTTTITSSRQTKERSEDFSNELVRAVETRPELYRGGHTSTDRLKCWKEIASELGESVTYCQEEWRCLKKLFQNHVREGNGPDDTHDDDMDKQMELMAFLVPYVNQESDESEGEEEAEELVAQDDEQFEDPLDNKFVVFDNVGLSKPTVSRPIVSRKRKMDTIPDDSSKKLFLLSLMPDVRLMDNTQMRRFKRKVLEVIDDILTDDA